MTWFLIDSLYVNSDVKLSTDNVRRYVSSAIQQPIMNHDMVYYFLLL